MSKAIMANNRPDTSDDPKRILGRLELPEEDAVKFLEALHAYGHPSSAAFLRRCAYALIEHNKEKEPLNSPLKFEKGRRYSVFDKT